MSEQNLKISFQVRRMLVSDLSEIAILHIQIFPEYFLTHLGINFLERFYAEFVDQAGAYGNVAVSGGRLIGFVIGTADSSKLFGRFYQRNFVKLVLTVITRFFFSSDLRKEILHRLPHIGYAARSLFYGVIGKSSVGKMKAPSHVSARLLSIGILSEFRGQRIADKLLYHFYEQLRNDGITMVGLSVQNKNMRAIAFYEKTGWHREQVTESGIYFVHLTQPE